MTKSVLTTALAFVGAAFVTTTTFTTTASAETVQLRTSDLDIASPSGKAELAKRINSVARTYCRNQHDTGSNLPSGACVAGVKQELTEKVAARATSTRMAANH